jgi:hypothetical protein
VSEVGDCIHNQYDLLTAIATRVLPRLLQPKRFYLCQCRGRRTGAVLTATYRPPE